jgi:3-isopropylmalate/(R)-2-methylmalate dehydratase small subunit
MRPFDRLRGRYLVLPAANVDTDQIIPARFLKGIDKEGLGRNLFADWRYDAQGRPRPEFVLNRPDAEGAPFLVAGGNFGCGSSREHAPWALAGFGFRVIVSTSFADIFRNNCLKNALLPVTVDPATHAALVEGAGRDPGAEIEVDLEAQTLRLPDGRAVPFPIDPFSKRCLTQGVDPLGYILGHETRIAEHERSRS